MAATATTFDFVPETQAVVLVVSSETAEAMGLVAEPLLLEGIDVEVIDGIEFDLDGFRAALIERENVLFVVAYCESDPPLTEMRAMFDAHCTESARWLAYPYGEGTPQDLTRTIRGALHSWEDEMTAEERRELADAQLDEALDLMELTPPPMPLAEVLDAPASAANEAPPGESKPRTDTSSPSSEDSSRASRSARPWARPLAAMVAGAATVTLVLAGFAALRGRTTSPTEPALAAQPGVTETEPEAVEPTERDTATPRAQPTERDVATEPKPPRPSKPDSATERSPAVEPKPDDTTALAAAATTAEGDAAVELEDASNREGDDEPVVDVEPDEGDDETVVDVEPDESVAASGDAPEADSAESDDPNEVPDEPDRFTELRDAIEAGHVGQAGELLATDVQTGDRNWYEAMTMCRAMSFWGAGGWQLPTAKQARALARARLLPDNRMWTATRADREGKQAFAIDGRYGRYEKRDKHDAFPNAVCVREEPK